MKRIRKTSLRSTRISLAALSALTAMIPAAALAQTQSGIRTSQEYKGKLQARLAHTSKNAVKGFFKGLGDMWMDYDYSTSYRDDKIATSSKLIVSSWGERKISVTVVAKGEKGWTDLRMSLVGFGNSFGSYDLYGRTADNTEPTPSAEKPGAELSISDKSAYLRFFNGYQGQTSNGHGTCRWSIERDASIEFSR